MWDKQQAASQYKYTNQVTAGHLKSYQLLLEKALQNLHLLQENKGDDELRNKTLNIVAQVQHGLALDKPVSREIHKALAHIWDAIAYGNAEVLHKAEKPLEYFLETMILLQQKSNFPKDIDWSIFAPPSEEE